MTCRECQSWHQCLQLGVVALGLRVRFLIISSLYHPKLYFSSSRSQAAAHFQGAAVTEKSGCSKYSLVLISTGDWIQPVQGRDCCPAAVQGGIRDSWLEGRSSLCIWLPNPLIKTLRNSWFYKTLLPEGLWGSRIRGTC